MTTGDGDRGQGRGGRSGSQGGGRGRRRRGGRGPRPGGDGPAEELRPVSEALRGALERALSDGEYVVFDLETTGGNPERNGITEIFAVRYRGGEALDTFGSLVNPGIPIPPIVRRMTGIDNKMVRGAPRIAEIMPDFVKFIGDAVLVSHNTIGDMKFVRHFARETTGADVGNFFLCTHLLVERLASEAPDKSLKGLADFFDLPRGSLHRAEADTWLTLELFKVLLGRLNDRRVARIIDAVRLQGDLESAMRLGWGIDEQMLASVPQGPGVLYLYDQQGKVLFLSSASHLDREVTKLRGHGQLPRQLLRIVLKSCDVKAERSANLIEAMYAEGEAIARHNPDFNPINWHQRCIQALFLAQEPAAGGDGGDRRWRLDIGPLETGTMHAWGPVRDRRIAGEFVGRVAEVFGLKAGRRGLILTAEQGELVRRLLDGSLASVLPILRREARSLALWFKPAERRRRKEVLSLHDRLAGTEPPPRMTPLLEHHGALVTQDRDGGAWQAHGIVGSRPVRTRRVNATRSDLEDRLRQSGLAAELRAELARGGEPARPLDAREVHLANATVWWILNARGDVRYLTLGELEGTAAETQTTPEK